MKIKQISPQENEYTKILTSIPNKPQALYYGGILPQKRQISVAIVGSRKPTSYGREIASRLAFELASRGVIVVSGLALGIDALAHRAALDAGGVTLAIQANGLHKIYPHTNRDLGNKIIDQGGAIITEYEEGIEPLPYHFLARNRIVSGLSDIIVVVEAAKRSGTLSTATHALEQGKDVYAVPGNITNPTSAGCNNLIAHGATPISSIREFVDHVAPLSQPNQQTGLPFGGSPLEAKIIELIQAGVRDGEELQIKSGATASDFSTALTMLEINGTIRALGANKWSL